MSIDFLAEAETIREELIARRRDFHRHPELGFEEVRTSRIVAEELGALGLEVQTGVGQTGVVGILEGDKDGPTILYRADMDALPVFEENTTDYVSEVTGKMHACGHDGHTAIALGIAKLLSRHRSDLHGRVKFVFQPAEELGGEMGGALAMINDGVLISPEPDIALGIHLWNDFEVGTVSVVSGPVMAGASAFEVKITGKGGHGAMPHQTHDPIVCAAQVIVALQTIVSRNADPQETVVLSIGQISGGHAMNVIPQEVSFTGSYRIFSEDMRSLVTERIAAIATGVATAMGCHAEFTVLGAIGVVNNDQQVADRTAQVFSEISNVEIGAERWMASEDVGLFLDAVPGAYLLIGSADNARGLNYPHHHPKFDFDEDVLPLSVGLMSGVIADYLQKGI